MCVVEGGRERVDIDRQRARARAPEGRDDVYALTGAREESSEQCAAEGTVACVPGRALSALLIIVSLWFVAVALLFVWPSAKSGPPAHADVVVVLSGGLNRRLDPALKLVQEGVAPVLAISSAFKDPNWTKAHRLCRGEDGATRFRVLCFAAVPYSTRGEARAIARLARERGWSKIVVVTSTYHVTRARMLIRRCYHGRLWMVGTSAPTSRLPKVWVSETGKLIVQALFEGGC